MNDQPNTDLSATRRQKIAVATTALQEIEQESENRRVALEKALHELKIAHLEIDRFQIEVKDMRDAVRTASNERGEAIARAVTAETKLQNIGLICASEPQKQLPAPANPEASFKAVETALAPGNQITA